MNPKKRADRISRKHGKALMRLIAEARALVDPPAILDPAIRAERHARMGPIADSIAALVGPETPCKRGCAFCCYQAVIIPRGEAERIAAAIGRALTPASLESDADMRKARERYAGKPCPFLRGVECTIYAVRPLVCRTHFSVADDSRPCDTANNPGARVPYFNLMDFAIAQGLLNLHDDWADVREFFP